MPLYSPQERAFMVDTYVKERYNARQTQRLFRRRFRQRPCPSVRCIRYNYNKYTTHGTSHNRHKGNSGRPKSVRIPNNIAAVRQDVLNNPTISARKNNVAVSKTSFNRTTKQDLNLHPYRIHIQQALQAGDMRRRGDFCNWLVARPQNFLLDAIIGDEVMNISHERKSKCMEYPFLSSQGKCTWI